MTIQVTDGRGQKLPIISDPGPRATPAPTGPTRTTPAPTEPGRGSGHRDFPTVTIGGEKVAELRTQVDSAERELAGWSMSQDLATAASLALPAATVAGIGMLAVPKFYRTLTDGGAGIISVAAMALAVNFGAAAASNVATSALRDHGVDVALAHHLGHAVFQVGAGSVITGLGAAMVLSGRTGRLGPMLVAGGTLAALTGVVNLAASSRLGALREQLHDARLSQAVSG